MRELGRGRGKEGPCGERKREGWAGSRAEGVLRERVRGTRAHACCGTVPAGGAGAVILGRSGTERRTARGAAERRSGPGGAVLGREKGKRAAGKEGAAGLL